ncbi:hypothetical protein [Vibrio furnissii]|uniref:hypothetical protein n=1 Tax=Vibrio furnissii TaxID=29494 RepID=UPI001EECEDBA|nr:hypothetical protein [Vibrio furnissii]
MESKSAKYGLLGAIVAALISGAIALYIHYDDKSEKQKEINEAVAADELTKTANLRIQNVYLPPVNTHLDSSFYAEIANESQLDAENIKVSINFGDASVTSCETLPHNAFVDKTKFDTSFVTFSYDKIRKKEKLHVYCLLSNPTFESLLITGNNLYSNVKFDRSDLNNISKESGSSFVTFFKVIGSGIAVIFLAYFTIAIIQLIHLQFKKLGVRLE